MIYIPLFSVCFIQYDCLIIYCGSIRIRCSIFFNLCLKFDNFYILDTNKEAITHLPLVLAAFATSSSFWIGIHSYSENYTQRFETS
jgi:hypothetical protein